MVSQSESLKNNLTKRLHSRGDIFGSYSVSALRAKRHSVVSRRREHDKGEKGVGACDTINVYLFESPYA